MHRPTGPRWIARAPRSRMLNTYICDELSSAPVHKLGVHNNRHQRASARENHSADVVQDVLYLAFEVEGAG
eukprot:1049597-Prorocentrum_minimum.AAC.4